MSRPIVAIVGRPNVGKSTLLNRILGWRKAIVDPQSGLTRDRLYGVAEWRGREFTIVDTAGLDMDGGKNESRAAIEAQTKVAIQEADLIVLLLDVREGLTRIDREIVHLLRRSSRRVLVAAHQADSPHDRQLAHEITAVGVDEAQPVSARDRLEQYSLMRGIHAMERADAVLLVIEASTGVLAQDKHVAGYALEAGKGLVIVVNKIDLVEPAQRKPAHWRTVLTRSFKFAPFAPIVTVSALTKESIGSVIPAALEVVGQRRIKMPPNELNKVLRQAFTEHPPPSFKGRRLRLGYATQAASESPTVVMFVNDVGLLHFSYRRYLEKAIRDRFGLHGNPLKLVLRAASDRRTSPPGRALRAGPTSPRSGEVKGRPPPMAER